MSPDAGRRPLVIAHRGASALAPENTLAAFKLALALGADGVEMDVHLTADGQPVVIHDARVNRTTSGSGAVSKLTASQIARLDAGAWFERRLALRPRTRRRVARALELGERDPRQRPRACAGEGRGAASEYLSDGPAGKAEPFRTASGRAAGMSNLEPPAFPGECIPTLEAVLNLLVSNGFRRAYVEIKGTRSARSELLRSTIRLIRSFKLEGSVTLLSFDHKSISLAKQIAPEMRAAIVIPAARGAVLTARAVLRSAEEAGADEVALHYGLVTRRTVDALHQRNLTVSAWTVNRKVIMRRLVRFGVDSIITNVPDRLLAVLE